MNRKLLSRYLDGELPPEEAARVEQALRRDPALRRHLVELRTVGQIVREAMQAPAGAGAAATSVCDRLSGDWRRLALAAGVVLAVGVGVGWLLHAPPAVGPSAMLPQGKATIKPEYAQVAAGQIRAIVHVSGADANRFHTTLDGLETLLERYHDARKQIELEIIANGPGLDLLRLDTSPASARIRELQEKYGNLTFLACRKTLERLRNKHGKDVTLVPGVKVAPSALEQILMRLQSGWTYIQA